MFCSVELAERIEQAECALMHDSAAAAALRRPDDASIIEDIRGGVAVFAGAGSPICKVAGLGFDGTPTADEMSAVEDRFARHGSPVAVELSTLADPDVGAFLTSRGYVLRGNENILGCALKRCKHVDREGVETRLSGKDEFESWLDCVATGFASPDTQGIAAHEDFPRELIELAIRDMAGVDGFVRFIARREGSLAGAASMRLHGGVANLCGATTLPEHRRRGVQASLLGRRLRDAAAGACDIAVVTVQPGSKSQENVQHQGFELLYSRAVLVRERA